MDSSLQIIQIRPQSRVKKGVIELNKYIFIGPNRVGKSSLILSISKVLAKLDKKVLVIDTTVSQGIKSFFDFNFQVEPKDPLESRAPVIRENFSILFTNVEDKFDFTKLEEILKEKTTKICVETKDVNTLVLGSPHSGKSRKMLSKTNFNKYDYVFIEADKNIDKKFINDAKKVFLLQDWDKDTLEKNKKILNKLKIELSRLQIVFVNKIDGICDNMYFLSELIPCVSNKFQSRNEDIEFYFSEQDFYNITESKIDGHIYLSDFTDEYKAAVFNVVNQITEITPRQFKKIVK